MASIKQLPDGKYQARFRDDTGRQHSKRFQRKGDAQDWLDAHTASIVRGDFVAPRDGEVTFREYGERWRLAQLHHRPSTAEHVESRLRLHVYPYIGDRQMRTITRSDIQALVAKVSETQAPSSTEVVYSFVSQIFTSAVVDRLIAASPCVRIKLPRVVEAKVVPLTVAQVSAIHDAMPSYYKPMVTVAAATGLRPGELRGLTVDRITPVLHVRGDVEPQEATLRVDRQLADVLEGRPVWGPPKTPAADRLVRVGPSTVRVLLDHLEERGVGPEGLVFTGRLRQPITRKTLAGVWQQATKGMALKPRSGWHELRHFHASLLIAEGLSPRAVADRLGHKDPAETLRTYSHLWIDDEDRSIAATEAAIGHLGA